MFVLYALIFQLYYSPTYFQVITSAIPESVGETLIGLVTSREEISDLLKVGYYSKAF